MTATINALLDSHREAHLTNWKQADLVNPDVLPQPLVKFHAMDSRHLTVRDSEDFFLRAEDMEANPAGWVCLGLKELSSRLEESSEEVFPEVVCNQTARLTQLEILFVERKHLPPNQGQMLLPDMVRDGEEESFEEARTRV